MIALVSNTIETNHDAGMAEDMEEGWWGPKMWAASVKIALPDS